MAKSNALELSIKIAGKIDDSFGAAISTAQNKTSALSKAISNIGKAGLALEGTLLTGTVTLLSKCADYAEEWEVSMADVAKYVDGLTDENGQTSDKTWSVEENGNGKTYRENYNNMQDQLFKLSTQFALTPEELAAMASNLGQSGYSAERIATTDSEGNVTGVLRDTAVMAAAFDIDTEQAGEWMAKWENAFSMSHEDVLTLTDQINYLGNTSATTAAEIAEAVNRAGSLGGISGVDQSVTAALATTMLQAGGDASTVGTSLNRIFVNLTKGSSATSTQEKGFAAIGLDPETVAKQLSMGGDTATNTIKDVFTRISKLDKDKQTSTMSNLFGQWAIGDAARVVANLPALQEALDKVSATGTAENGQPTGVYTGSMEAEATTKNSTTAATRQMRENARLRFMQSVGEPFLEVQSSFNKFMVSFYNSLTDNMPAITKLTETFVQILNQFSGKFENILSTALPYLQTALDWVADNPTAALKAVGGVTATFAAMTQAPTVEKIVTSTSNLLFGGSKKESSGLLSFLTGSTSASTAAKNATSKTQSRAGLLSLIMGSASSSSTGTGTKRGGLLSSLYTGGQNLWKSVMQTAQNTPAEISAVKSGAQMANQVIGGSGIISRIDNSIFGGSTVLKNITGLFSGNNKAASSANQNIVNSILGARQNGTPLSQYVSNVSGAASALKNTTIGKGIQSAGSGLLNFGKNSVNAAGQILGGIVNYVSPFGPNTTQKAGSFLGNVAGGAKSLFSTFAGNVAQIPSNFWQTGLGQGLSAGGQKIKNIAAPVTSFLSAGGNLLGTALSPVTSVLGTVGGGFMSLFSGIAPIIGIVSTVIALISILTDNLDGVRTIVGNVFGEKGLAIFDGFIGKVQGIVAFFTSGGFAQAFTQAEKWITQTFGEKAGAAFSALAPIIQSVFGFVQQIVAFAENTVKPIIEELFSFCVETVAPAALDIFIAMSPAIAAVGNLLGGAIMIGVNLIGNLLKDIVIPALEWIFTGMLNFATAVAPTVASVIEGIAATVTTVVNAIISAINWVIEGIDSLSFDIPEWVPLVGGQHIGFDFTPLPLLATGGFTNGPSIAGEAGTEAVISFDPSVRDQNIANWLRAGEMLGVNKEINSAAQSAALADNAVRFPMLAVTGALETPQAAELKDISNAKSESDNITFAPVFNFYGDVTKEKAEEAGRVSFAEFKRLYKQMKREEERKSLA